MICASVTTRFDGLDHTDCIVLSFDCISLHSSFWCNVIQYCCCHWCIRMKERLIFSDFFIHKVYYIIQANLPAFSRQILEYVICTTMWLWPILEVYFVKHCSQRFKPVKCMFMEVKHLTQQAGTPSHVSNQQHWGNFGIMVFWHGAIEYWECYLQLGRIGGRFVFSCSLQVSW